MGHIPDTSGALFLGGASLLAIANSSVGTPTYVYDLDGIGNEVGSLVTAFEGAAHLVAYAVKANSGGPILRKVAEMGGGADVVSGAELGVALGAGIAASNIVFSGVAKKVDEIDRAIRCGDEGIAAIQAESVEELVRIAARAKEAGRQARVSFRLNPAVDLDTIGTHAHIATGHDEAKFGIPIDTVGDALGVVARSPDLNLVGVGAHVGSQFTSIAPYVEAAQKVIAVAGDVRRAGFSLELLSTGGGFGIDYGTGCPVKPAEFVHAARKVLVEAGFGGVRHVIEPGRSIVAPHGVLLAKVIQTKSRLRDGVPAKRWLMIDAGMNDLIRPALYQAHHRIVPLELSSKSQVVYRVVGPVCESSDDFGEHSLPEAAPPFVAILDAGAYGFTMASRYNGRALPAEVFVTGGRVVIAREREPSDAWEKERLSIGK